MRGLEVEPHKTLKEKIETVLQRKRGRTLKTMWKGIIKEGEWLSGSNETKK